MFLLRFMTAATFTAGLFVLSGCGDGKTGGKAAGSEATNAVGQTSAVGPKTIEQMAPGDVIVSVNGAPLTKQEFDFGMKRILQRIGSIPNAQQSQKVTMLRMAVQNFIPEFIESQLLVQEAQRAGVVSESYVKEKAAEIVKATALREKKEPSVFEAEFIGGRDALYKGAEQVVWMNALIASNIPPVVKVDDKFLEATYASIKADNDAIAYTNSLKAARLNELRKEILAGKDFGVMADTHSECERSAPGNHGYWGEYEREEFADRKMRAAIFSLKPGDLSEVLEDEEGYHLVKVLEYVPPKKNEKGVVIQKEAARLAHILIKKIPVLEVATPATLKDELAMQMQKQATDAVVETLKAKAVILYPNGTNLWSKPKKAPSAHQAQPKTSGNGPTDKKEEEKTK